MKFRSMGSDSINNKTYDADYFQQFSQNFYYKLEDWMRGAIYIIPGKTIQ